jgi:hypothetical protein
MRTCGGPSYLLFTFVIYDLLFSVHTCARKHAHTHIHTHSHTHTQRTSSIVWTENPGVKTPKPGSQMPGWESPPWETSHTVHYNGTTSHSNISNCFQHETGKVPQHIKKSMTSYCHLSKEKWFYNFIMKNISSYMNFCNCNPLKLYSNTRHDVFLPVQVFSLWKKFLQISLYLR